MNVTGRVLLAARGYGWALALGAVVVALFVFLVVLPSGGVDTTPTHDDGPTVIVPASPGLTRAEEVCKNGVVSKDVMYETGDMRYTAIFGLAVLKWPDSPRGKNPIGLLDGEPLTLSDEVMKCLKERS